ncbi:MAG: hypothetical protein WD226_02825 [Planctomycetota bacterium]
MALAAFAPAVFVLFVFLTFAFVLFVLFTAFAFATFDLRFFEPVVVAFEALTFEALALEVVAFDAEAFEAVRLVADFLTVFLAVFLADLDFFARAITLLPGSTATAKCGTGGLCSPKRGVGGSARKLVP